MSGSMKWFQNAVDGKVCEKCFARFTKHAARGLSVRLIENRGGQQRFSALVPSIYVPCSNCRHPHHFSVDDVSRADLKRVIDLLQGRVGPVAINPFTGEPLHEPDLVDGQKGDPRLHYRDATEFDPSTDSDFQLDGEEDGDPDKPDGASGPPDQLPTSDRDASQASGGRKRKHPNSGRRLATPSVRTCCPPQPISDQVLRAAVRTLRAYSFRRSSKSYKRLMRRFGVETDRPDSTDEPSPPPAGEPP